MGAHPFSQMMERNLPAPFRMEYERRIHPAFTVR